MVSPVGFRKSFFWNVDQTVGVGGVNELGDVELVRFGYVMVRQSGEAANKLWDYMMPQLMAMRPQGAYGDDLGAVIRAHQAHRGGPQDGVISPAKVTGTNLGHYDKKRMWMIVLLNNVMRDYEWYPRIDQHPIAGATVSQQVQGIMLGA